MKNSLERLTKEELDKVPAITKEEAESIFDKIIEIVYKSYQQHYPTLKINPGQRY